MSNLKKTIQINPELFKIQSSNKSRTKSNRDKSKKSITPSFLKKQLIERIKSHKNKLESTLKHEEPKEEEKSKHINDDNDDEFILSMNFLTSLKDEHKTQPKTTFVDNISVSNNRAPEVNINLPFELLENNDSFEQINVKKDINLEEFEPELEAEQKQEPEIKRNYVPLNDVPYGCLKNGNKPTYRSWMNKSTIHKNETIKNYGNTNTNTDNNILDREKKLTELKNKFSKEKEKEKEKEKVFIKRTIKRKYTLGKSNIKKKVGILLKNINTRKQITDSYKDLKTHEITDVKTYLRNRGLIRIGNTTPHDILRKIYESSILTGDVTNNNKDIMLHNLLNDS
jgi:hypothetical protein